MMDRLILDNSQYDVVFGPCPGCLNWQLDYTYRAAREWVEIRVEEVREFGSDVPVDVVPTMDPAAFYLAIEDVLREHLNECPHLQHLIAEGDL